MEVEKERKRDYIKRLLFLLATHPPGLAGVAQSVERLICNQQVGGSIPLASSKFRKEGHRPPDIFKFLFAMGRYPSGQRGQTVNLLATPSEVRILLSPPDGVIFFSLPESDASTAGIAQSVRASAFQAEGRGFESRFPLQDHAA
jgi:hypothetical protein